MAAYSYSREKSKDAMFAVKEAYRAIRTNLMFSIVKEGCRTFIFTSSIQGEGKTTTAANVAFSIARSQKKTLLLDLDFHKPRVHRLLKLKNIPGMTNFLGGFNSFEEVLHKDVFENLDVITAGTISPNPAEIISSDLMTNFLEDIKKKYEYIIIDTPPVTVVADALSIMDKVDGVVFVARYKYAHHNDIKAATEKIKFVGGKIVGAIVNGMEDYHKSGKYYSHGKYGYKYGYSTGYGNNDTENLEEFSRN